MSESYLEICKQAAASIDGDALSELKLSKSDNDPGAGFEFRKLGRISVLGEKSWVGLKVSTKNTPLKAQAEIKLQQELGIIGVEVDFSPELLPLMPRFMSLVRVSDTDISAILTEDATEGGAKKLFGVPASDKTREALYKPVQPYGEYREMMDGEELDRTVAYEVDGKERLLDFTPSPIRSYLDEALPFRAYFLEVLDSTPELTVTIPEHSPLGQDLQRA